MFTFLYLTLEFKGKKACSRAHGKFRNQYQTQLSNATLLLLPISNATFHYYSLQYSDCSRLLGHRQL